MDEHCRSDDRVLLLTGNQRGVVIIESLAAMAVFFMLLVIIVQLAFVLVAREVAETAVDAAARRAARPAADLVQVEERLRAELERVVPGAEGVEATVRLVAEDVEVQATITWAPPGPDLIPVVIHVESTAAISVPP